MSTKTKTEITFPNYTCDLPIFESITQLENYILTNKKASTGQICGVIIDGETSYYSINADKTTTEVGTSGGGSSLVTYELDSTTTGMGTTSTTIATRADVSTNGWYLITDENYVDSYVNGSWSYANKTSLAVTQQPYILGSNNEDVLILNFGTDLDNSNAYLSIPSSGLNKNIKILSRCSQFYLKKYAVGNTNTMIQGTPQYYNYALWYVPNDDNSIIFSNSMCDYIELGAGYLSIYGDIKHPLLSTSLTALYPDGSAFSWGNSPDLLNQAQRYTLTAVEYAKVADGSLIAGQWLTGTDVPDNALGIDGEFYLRSNGDVYLKGSGTWTYLCSIAPDTGMWKDIIIYPTAMGSGASSPDLITFVSGGLQIYGFDGANTTEQLFGSFEMQHDYAEGSDLDIHVHWTPTTSAAGNVKWFFEYSIANMGGVFPAPTTISSVNSTTATAWKHIYSDIGLVSGTGLKIGHCINFRLYRNPTDADDTYGADAGLLSVGVHYKANTLGSREETAK